MSEKDERPQAQHLQETTLPSAGNTEDWLPSFKGWLPSSTFVPCPETPVGAASPLLQPCDLPSSPTQGHQHRAHGNGAASAGHDGCLKLFRSLSLDKDTLFCINLSNSVAFTEIHYCQATSPPLLSEDAFRAFNRWFKAYQRKDRFPKNITFSILKEQSPNPLCQCNVHQPSTLLKVNTRNFK